MADEQDRAESLDADVVDDDGRIDEDDLTDYPPDSYQGVDEYGLTAAEERFEEPLAERVLRETPDPLVEELEGHGRRLHAVDAADVDGEVSAENAAMHVERDR